MHRRKLPIGIQTFREIREDDYYYVDKTALAHRLIEGGKYFFGFRAAVSRFACSRALGLEHGLSGHPHQLWRGRAA